MELARVMLVANRTAADAPLVEAVRLRARRGPAVFHLVVPATPSGLHRVVDPEVAGREIAADRLARALPVLAEAAGQTVTGHVGDANPLCAVQDALHLQGFDEIILSTLPWRVSQWLRVDLPRKIRALGLPVLHLQRVPLGASGSEVAAAPVGARHAQAPGAEHAAGLLSARLPAPLPSAPHSRADVSLWPAHQRQG